MTEFFKGWRRRSGIVMLALASLFATGWVRSYVFDDYILRDGRDDIIIVESVSGGISWERNTHDAPSQTDIGWEYHSIDAKSEVYGDKYDGCTVHWRWRWAGFDFGELHHPFFQMTIVEWTIPYWAVTAPLTIISAWLILGKPRK
jgi:hypothetical protein